MRLLFAGTPAFADVQLAALLSSDHEVVGVLTQPDRPAGRGRGLKASPVKTRALAADLPLFQPHTLKDPGAIAWLEAHGADAMVVAAYGLILPPAVLALFPRGCVNVHASLLPRWRGAAPIQRAILAGDEVSGVSIMRMDEGLDTGPVYALRRCPIGPEDTSADLHDRLAELGARTLVDTLARLDTLRALPQDESGACYASKLSKDEALLDWGRPAAALHRQIRALIPWPVAHAMFGRPPQRLRILEARIAGTDPAGAPPGTILATDASGITIACDPGALRLQVVQRQGRAAVAAADFLRGTSLEVGQPLS